MATTFYAKANDAKVTITATLYNADDTVVDLTNVQAVHVHVGKAGDTASYIIDGLCTVSLPKTAGIVTYVLTAADLAHEERNYDIEFETTWAAGRINTFPSKGNLKFVLGGEVH